MKHRIILVDDHNIVIDGLQSVLKSSDFEVVGSASNGQEALHLINQKQDELDLILSDIDMPVLNGTELCRIVKKQFPKIKVILLSMYNSPEIVKEVVAAEPDGFILKNSGKDELLLALSRVVNNIKFYSAEILPVIYSQIIKHQEKQSALKLLSEREKEVLALIVQEYTSDQIAEKLSISKRTVDNHRLHILEKTGCKSTIGLVKFALMHGIV
jgi:DNA-binding NarL/FixJ family response regulator